MKTPRRLPHGEGPGQWAGRLERLGSLLIKAPRGSHEGPVHELWLGQPHSDYRRHNKVSKEALDLWFAAGVAGNIVRREVDHSLMLCQNTVASTVYRQWEHHCPSMTIALTQTCNERLAKELWAAAGARTRIRPTFEGGERRRIQTQMGDMARRTGLARQPGSTSWGLRVGVTL